MDRFQYGGILFDPSHYQTLSYIESKHNNKLFINPDFKKGKAGYMQLSPIAFADLKEQGFFKDREYNSLTPQEVLAGSMKYASRLGEHYGFTDPKWNAAAYNMGPSKARELYDKYGGKLNKAVLDPNFPQTTKDYLFDYNYTTLTKERHGNEDVNKMYDIIKNDRDVNSLDIAPSKKAMGGVIKYVDGGPTTTNPLYQDSLNLYNGNKHFEDYLVNQNKLYGDKLLTSQEYTDIKDKYEKYYPKEFNTTKASEWNLYKANNNFPEREPDPAWKKILEYGLNDSDKTRVIRSEYTKPTNIPRPLPATTASNIAATKQPVVAASIIDTPVIVPPRVQYWDKNGKITTEDTFLDKWPQRKYQGGVPTNVNSLNIATMRKKNKTPKYFWGALIQAGVNKIKEEKAKDKAFMNSSNMGAAGTALGSMITSAGDAIGTQEDASKANVIQGAAVSTLGGLMSGGIMGGLIAAPTSLIKYSANAIAQGSRKESQQEAWINGHTTGIDTGTNYQFKLGGVPKYHMGSDTHDTDPPKGNTYGVPVKDTIYPNGNNKFLFDKYKNPDYIVHSRTKGRELSAFEKTLDIVDRTLSAPSRYMVQAVTGKYQDPSEAWGYKDPKGFMQNAANFGIDMVADPMNLLGVGIASKIGKVIKVGDKVTDAAKVGKKVFSDKVYENLWDATKYADMSQYIEKFNKFTGAPIYKNSFDIQDFNKVKQELINKSYVLEDVAKKSLAVNKTGAATALVNDAINIKQGDTDTYEPHYSKTSNFGPLATGYKGLPQSNQKQGTKFTKKLTTIPVKQEQLTTIPVKQEQLTQTLAAAPSPMVMNQFNKIVNGKKVPISKEEFQSINSKGKITTDTMPTYLKGVVPDSLKNKQKLQIRDISKKEMGGYSIEGYRKDSPDKNKPFVVIPGTNISMQDVLHKVLGVGSNGQTQVMMPGQQYNFGASTHVTEFPIKKEEGGAPDVVPMAQITPLQSSKDELVIHPNYDVTKTAARKTHAEYTKTGQNEKVSDTLQPLQRDEVGNVIAPGAYVVSNAKELKIPVALAKQMSLGVDPAYYAKDEHLPEAKERNVADEFFNNKKEMTPAELLKSVLKKIPEPKRDSKTDMFAKQTSVMNKAARVPMLEIVKKTNDFLRNLNGPQDAEAMQDPNAEQTLNTEGVPKAQYGAPVMPSYLNYPLYGNAYTNNGNVLTGTLGVPGDGNPPAATPDYSASPYLNTSITKDWRKDYLNTAKSPEGAAVTKYSQPAKAGSPATPDYMATLLQQIQGRKYPGNANNAALAAMANGFGASMLSALQNPTNEVYATNPTLMDRKFAPEDVNLRTRIYDNSMANRDAITLKGLESTGVSAQKSQFYLQSNDNVEKRNAAVLSAIQANNQLGRAKANAIDQNRRGIVDQNNTNQKDYNRYLYNITKPLSDTAGNIGNIYQQDAQNRMAFDDRKERDMISVQQGQYMMDILNKQSGINPAASGTTNTSTIPIFKGTTQEEWEAFKKKYNIA